MITILTEKARATGIHLFVSMLVIALFFAVIYFIWFPAGLIKAGALEGLKLVVLVDLVLGPLLTFVVFNRAKASLKWDLSLIVLIQLAALAYGGKTVFDERPVIAVLSTDGMHLATASQVKEWGITEKYLTYTGPANYYLDVGNDLAKIMPEEAVHVFSSDTPYAMQVEKYEVLLSVEADVFEERIKMITRRLMNNKVFNDLSARETNGLEQCVWLPLSSKHIADQGFACIDQQVGIEKIKIIPYPSL